MPLWVILVGGAIAAFAAYKIYQNYSANSAANAANTAAGTAGTAPATDTSGGASTSPTDLTPVEDLASALNGLTAVLGGGGAGVSPTAPPTTDTSQPATTSSDVGAAPAPTINIYNPGNAAPAASPAARAPTAASPSSLPLAGTDVTVLRGAPQPSSLAEFAASALASGASAPIDLNNVQPAAIPAAPLYSGTVVVPQLKAPSAPAPKPAAPVGQPSGNTQKQKQQTGLH